MDKKTCLCPQHLLYGLYICPRKKREDDLGPPEEGWCILRGHVAVNIAFCPFCGGGLKERSEKLVD